MARLAHHPEAPGGHAVHLQALADVDHVTVDALGGEVSLRQEAVRRRRQQRHAPPGLNATWIANWVRGALEVYRGVAEEVLAEAPDERS